MTVTRKLFLCCIAIFVSTCLVSVPQPRTGELRYIVQFLIGRIDNDSSFYMDRAWAVVKSGGPLYQKLFFEEHLKFIYPTSSLLLYWLAEKIHLSGGRLVELLEVVSLPATLAIAGEIFLLAAPLDEGRHSKAYRRLLIAALGLLFYPLIAGASCGQIQTFMTLLWTVAVYCQLTGRIARAGICVAAVCAFKPMFAVFLLWAVVRRDWRFLAGFTAAMVAIQAAAIAAFGWHDEIGYLAVLNYLSRHGETIVGNQSVNGLLERLLNNGSLVWSRTVYPPFNRVVYLGTLLSSLVMVGFGLLFPLFQRSRNHAQDFILFGMIATLATPIAWDHHYGYFYAGGVYFLALGLKSMKKQLYAFVACFLVLANSWQFMDRLASTHWNLLLNLHLFAGLGVILLTAFSSGVFSETTLLGSSLQTVEHPV